MGLRTKFRVAYPEPALSEVEGRCSLGGFSEAVI
jgi:hypothetical protein